MMDEIYCIILYCLQVVLLRQPGVATKWVAGSTLPVTAIKDYENSIQKEMSLNTVSHYGQKISVASLKTPLCQSQWPKKTKTERLVIKDTEG